MGLPTVLGGISYLLRDDFTVADVAPWANPHICDVVGTMLTSQVDGQFSSAAGRWVIPAQTTPVWGDLGAWDSIGRARVAGLAVFVQMNFGTLAACLIGFDKDQAGIANEILFNMPGGAVLNIYDGTGIRIAGNMATGTDYEFAVILRATGAYLYARGGIYGTIWRLLWVDNASNTATAYANLNNHSAVATSETFRVAQLPLSDITHPTLSDNFSVLATSDGLGHLEADGYGAGHTYAGMAGASVVGNKLYNTPAVGADVIVDGGMDGVCGGDWTCGANWSIAAGVATHAAVAQNNLTQTVAPLVAGTWYRLTYTITGRTAGGIWPVFGTQVGAIRTGNATYTETGRANGTAFELIAGATFDGSVDNVICVPIAMADILRVADLSMDEPYSEIDVTEEVGYQHGLTICLDSAGTPTSVVNIYCNRASNLIHVDKYVAGAFTNLANVAFAYAAGATPVARLEGTRLYFWYNGAYIGNVPVADAQIVSNPQHGYLHSGGAASYLEDGIIYDTDRGSQYNKYFVGA